jgi:uncharacterized protein (TIRG00374 family)
MRARVKRGVSLGASVIIGFGLLGGVLYWVGWRDVLAQVHALGAMGLLAVLGTVALTMVAWILSWWVVLRAYGISLPLGTVTAARLGGYAVTYLTPTLYFGGEPVRAMMVSGRTPAPATRVFATIVVERFLGGLSLLAFILIGAFYAIASPSVTTVGRREVIIGVAFITFWIVIGLIDFAGNLKWISRVIGGLGRLLPRWRSGLSRAALRVSETEDEISTAFTKHWKATLLAFLLQLLATFFSYMRPQVFFHFSIGRMFDFSQLSLLFTLNILLSFLLWITPGGVGTSEAALIGIFSLVGVAKGGAVAFSLVFKAFELILVALGLWLLVRRGLRRLSRRAPLRDAEQQDRVADAVGE